MNKEEANDAILAIESDEVEVLIEKTWINKKYKELIDTIKLLLI
ncbi:hypothetical protein [Oceanobacillus damuensis]|nr:hypothetical protein [Oceanobacillus damuensis]